MAAPSLFDTLRAYRPAVDRYITAIVTPGVDSEAEEFLGEESIAHREPSKYEQSDTTRLLFLVTSVFAIITTGWHLLYVVYPVMFGVPFRATHLLLMGTLLFLMTLSLDGREPRKRLWNALSILLILGLIAGNLYLILDFDQLWQRAGAPTDLDVYMSVILILVTLEGARRAAGNAFFVIGVGALFYGVYGQYFPGILNHQPIPFRRLVTSVAIPNLTGLYGFFLDLSATLITIFIFFGVFLQYLGGAQFLGDFAIRIAGRLRSGPAQVAIISSLIMGMMSGAAVANVAATGSFSIPLMKKMGYEKEYAGAIEAVASTGGQIMPPIMGAAAFIMAQITGRSYFEVVVAAAIPAFLYYITLMLTAHLRAVKKGFQPMEAESQASLTSLVLRSYFLIPIVLIILALYDGQPALISAWYGLRALIALYIAYNLIHYRSEFLTGLKEIGLSLLKAFDGASRTMAPITLIIAEIAWVIEILQVTGVLQKISSSLLALSGGSLLLLLLLASLLCIIFGFGIPTTAAYLTVALIAAPALVQMNVNVLGAHLFVFYFAILSTISPPVAAACIVACGISGGTFLKTAQYALRFAFPVFLLPFIWIYNPAIIAQGTATEIALTFVTMLIAIAMIVVFFEGYLMTTLTKIERLLAASIAAGLIAPFDSQLPKVGSFLLFAVLLGLQLNRVRRKLPEPTVAKQ